MSEFFNLVNQINAQYHTLNKLKKEPKQPERERETLEDHCRHEMEVERDMNARYPEEFC
jgi:hypothetical protein